MKLKIRWTRTKIISLVGAILILGLAGWLLWRNGYLGADVAVSSLSSLGCPSQGRINANYSSKTFIPGKKNNAPSYALSVSLFDDFAGPISKSKVRFLLYKTDRIEYISPQTLLYDSGEIALSYNNSFQTILPEGVYQEGVHYFYKAIAINPVDGTQTTIMKNYDNIYGVQYGEYLGFVAKAMDSWMDGYNNKQVYIDINDPACRIYKTADTIKITGNVYASYYPSTVKSFSLNLIPKKSSSGIPLKKLIDITNPPSSDYLRFWYRYSTQISNLSEGIYIIEAKAINESDTTFTTSREFEVPSYDSQRKADLTTLKTAIDKYKTKTTSLLFKSGGLPPSDGWIEKNNLSTLYRPLVGGKLLDKLPCDPVVKDQVKCASGNTYQYWRHDFQGIGGSDKEYSLYAKLDNPTDSDQATMNTGNAKMNAKAKTYGMNYRVGN